MKRRRLPTLLEAPLPLLRLPARPPSPSLSTSSSGTEPNLHPAKGDDEDPLQLEDLEIPDELLPTLTDVEGAVELLTRSEFPLDAVCLVSSLDYPPFFSLSQLYSVVPDRTSVDREVARLVASGGLVRVSVPTSRARSAVFVQREAYSDLARDLGRVRGGAYTAAMELFDDLVLESFARSTPSFDVKEFNECVKGTSKPAHHWSAVFVQAGVLVITGGSYTFSLPGMGTLLAHWDAGNLLVLKRLAKMPRTQLGLHKELKRRPGAIFPAKFHLRELHGLGWCSPEPDGKSYAITQAGRDVLNAAKAEGSKGSRW